MFVPGLRRGPDALVGHPDGCPTSGGRSEFEVIVAVQLPVWWAAWSIDVAGPFVDGVVTSVIATWAWSHAASAASGMAPRIIACIASCIAPMSDPPIIPAMLDMSSIIEPSAIVAGFIDPIGMFVVLVGPVRPVLESAATATPTVRPATATAVRPAATIRFRVFMTTSLMRSGCTRVVEA